MKAKLMKAALSAMIGISMIGGGTWAAFNDVETVSSTVQAGTLDLEVNPSVVFNVNNLKPLDWMYRSFTLKNVGSLNIQKVLMHTSYTVKDKNGAVVTGADAEEFASQHTVFFLTSDNQVILTGLGSIKYLSDKTISNNSADITTWLPESIFNPRLDLPVNDTDAIKMGIWFDNDPTRETGSKLYKQNKFQGWKLDVKFNLEATQYPGQNRS